MEIMEQYPVKIEQWTLSPEDRLRGEVVNYEPGYTLSIMPDDTGATDIWLFHVDVIKTNENKATGQTVFYGSIHVTFRVRAAYDEVTPEFFYSLMDKATGEFAKLFYDKIKGTALDGEKIKSPDFTYSRPTIEKTIASWKKKFRDDAGRPRPAWQSKFRDLPEIPAHKQWTEGKHVTREQEISMKLLYGRPVMKEEEEIFASLYQFYEELDKRLLDLDYKSFSDEDFENFKNYIFYAFNYVIMVQNRIMVPQTFRLVVNQWVTGKNEPITNVKYLTYAPADIIAKANKYNRANTPKNTLFYSAENIDTALKEIKPPAGSVVTVGIWKPRDVNKRLIAFPISHSEVAKAFSPGVRDATAAFEGQRLYYSTMLISFMERYLKLMGREFTKVVDHHYGYLISSLFAERILAGESDGGVMSGFDCIIYPSVGNEYLTENIAVRPATIDKDFVLSGAVEFEIEETYYDRAYTNDHPDRITLAKIKNMRYTSNFGTDGEIRW